MVTSVLTWTINLSETTSPTPGSRLWNSDD